MGDRKSGHGVGFILRLIRFLAWLIFATWLGRKLLGWLFGAQQAARDSSAPPRNSPPAASRQLHRDPVCGTHVPEAIAVTAEVRGELFYFCSAECREKFRSRGAVA